MSADPSVSAAVAQPEVASASRESLWRRALRSELPVVVATIVVPLLLLVPVLRLWRMNFRIPMSYFGDAVFSLALVKNLIEHGAYLTNPSLGAPFGGELYDFPQGGDNLNLLVIRGIGLFIKDAALALNLFFLLTFSVVALSALLVMRRFGLSRPAAFLCAVLFTMLPFHFLHGEPHLFISAYWAVPLGAYLTLVTLDGGLLFRRREAGGPLTYWFSRTTVGTVAICWVAGSTGLYYGAYTVLLVSAAAVAALVARRSWSAFFSGLAAAAAVAAVLVVNLSPSIFYTWHHGRDPIVAQRAPVESEELGLKLASLVLPVSGDRIPALARMSQRYASTTTLPQNSVEAGAQALGTIGDIGFFTLVLVALASLVATTRWRPPPLLRHASFGMLVAFLFGTVSGFSVLFAYFVSPQLHVPGRICIFIAFFSLLAVGVLIDAAARRFLPAAHRGRWLVVAVVVLLALGVADQTSNQFVPDWAQVQQQWRSDAAFGQAVEGVLPRGAMVVQLPYNAFPESLPPAQTQPYDELKPYLHTTGIRWSYAAMKGRPQDWASAFATVDPRLLVPAVASAGFSAILVDRDGYADGGASLEGVLRAALGPPVAVSSDNRYALYDLLPYARQLRARHGNAIVNEAGWDTVHPVQLTMGAGFYGPESNGNEQWHWTWAPRVALQIANPGSSPQRVAFSTEIATGTGSTPVEISFPDGSRSQVVSGATPAVVRHSFTAPPGVSEITVSSNAIPAHGGPGDPRTLYLRFINTSALGASLAALSS